MKKIICPFIFLCLFSINSFSQEMSPSSTFGEFYDKQLIRIGETQDSLNFKDIQGSPYLNDQFVLSEILATNNIKYIEIPIRYNIYNDEMQFQKSSGEVFNLNKSIIKSIYLDNNEFVYYPFSSNERSYFEVVAKGKLTLLKRYQVRYIKAEPLKAFADPVPAKFLQTAPSYFAMSENAEAKKIDSVKGLLSILPSNKNEVNDFIKSKKLKIHKEADIKACIEFYNSIAK